MIAALDAIEVITVFVEDLPKAKAFYTGIFSAGVVYDDGNCCVFKLHNIALNLLQAKQATALVAPAEVARAGLGARLLLTIKVADVDAVCAQLKAHGATLLNGPLDRPWGRRTAAFADPAGNVWEVAQELPAARP